VSSRKRARCAVNSGRKILGARFSSRAETLGTLMIVYLDQNKWIELARMLHGRDTSSKASGVLRDLEAAKIEGRATFPLSSFHYIETSRVSNVDRKVRLGAAMWHFSRGITIIGYQAIVRHELEVALSKHLPQVNPGGIRILGKGHAHAFCSPPLGGVLELLEEEVERSMLMGNELLGIKPPASYSTTHREKFRQHLSTLHARYEGVPKEQRENWLYVMSTIDILNPIKDVMDKHGLEMAALNGLGEKRLKQVIDDMPTRRVDLHLHRQVLRNPNYVARVSDLEDWGGLAVASCYCDVLICEKHMANMLRRDGFLTHARVEVALENTLRSA
jgi:hypothetical protein